MIPASMNLSNLSYSGSVSPSLRIGHLSRNVGTRSEEWRPSLKEARSIPTRRGVPTVCAHVEREVARCEKHEVDRSGCRAAKQATGVCVRA